MTSENTATRVCLGKVCEWFYPLPSDKGYQIRYQVDIDPGSHDNVPFDVTSKEVAFGIVLSRALEATAEPVRVENAYNMVTNETTTTFWYEEEEAPDDDR